MKRIFITLALVLSVLTVSATQQSKPQQWEYKTEDKCFDDKRLNGLGSEGWELAGMTESGMGGRHCIFKRIK
jgi:hypothetical protein